MQRRIKEHGETLVKEQGYPGKDSRMQFNVESDVMFTVRRG
jgi:hypothetical protein